MGPWQVENLLSKVVTRVGSVAGYQSTELDLRSFLEQADTCEEVLGLLRGLDKWVIQHKELFCPVWEQIIGASSLVLVPDMVAEEAALRSFDSAKNPFESWPYPNQVIALYLNLIDKGLSTAAVGYHIAEPMERWGYDKLVGTDVLLPAIRILATGLRPKSYVHLFRAGCLAWISCGTAGREFRPFVLRSAVLHNMRGVIAQKLYREDLDEMIQIKESQLRAWGHVEFKNIDGVGPLQLMTSNLARSNPHIREDIEEYWAMFYARSCSRQFSLVKS